MNLLNTPERRVVAANFLLQLGFQSVYFVGIVGCATYVLGAGAFEVSALVFCLNLALIVGNFCSGAVVDAVGPRRTLASHAPMDDRRAFRLRPGPRRLSGL